MTTAELQAEKAYRYQERLGILLGAPGGPENPEAFAIAREEVIEWERAYKAQQELQGQLTL
jgi:hypothetical protein